MSGIRQIKLHRISGDEEDGAALGNNAAWNCSCDRTAPLLGSLRIRSGEVACPTCGQRYIVVAESRRASGVREVPESS